LAKADLPSGTVTFLFTDVEGSTRLLHELGAEAYADALAEHRRVIRAACTTQGGVEVDTQGDAFFFAFPHAAGALVAARGMIEGLASGPIRVRVGLHTGTPLLTGEGYVGDDVHFAARVAASGHGGQVVLSAATAAEIDASNSLLQALSLLDLGEHRLKDIAEPVAIFQLGDGSFPPLKTISNTNLPRPASSFVGREAELAEVLARIRAGARLMTLTGPGGSGKTRLALEAAATLVPEYKAGVFWVGLAALRDPALVTETIAQTLGAKDGLADYIGERELLLLLDNLEQVIEAAPELSRVLQSCPNLAILVTSRELLRVQGEVEYPVPPLASPEAVTLFCERVQLEPSEEIAELCARVDNLPLAVELAAARTKALSPAQILARISSRLDLLKGGRDADPRQQTLRATIEWSYDLLSEPEQELFRRLSVFAGGCTLEAAEQVCDADLDTLQSLVEKSLLRFITSEAGSRFWMLETIREFAAGRLEQAAQQRTRHALFYLNLGEREGARLQESSDPEVAARLEDDRANLRLAFTELVASQQAEAAERLLGAVWLFWFMRGYLREGQRLAEAVLSVEPDREAASRVDALWGATKFALFLGDAREAAERSKELLALSNRLADPRGVAIATEMLAMVALDFGDRGAARDLFGRSAELARERGDTFLLASIANNFGDLELREGNFDAARALFGEALAIGRAQRNMYRIAGSLANLGFANHGLGDVVEARTNFAESLDIALKLVDMENTACALLGLAICEPDLRRGAVLIGKADAIVDELDSSLEGFEAQVRQRTLETARKAIGDLSYDGALAQGHAMTLDEAVEYALASVD
jgi:predicted ATPase/class 3 adenylate cyclase